MDFYFQANGLSVGYSKKTVLENIDIRLNKGKILTLIGPNGSGKSTILKTIAREVEAIGGTLVLGGKPIENITLRQMSKLASVVLTEKPSGELLTCGDVASSGRYPYTGMMGILSQEDRDKVEKALRTVGAWEFESKLFSQVSDGQRQKVLLARAICQEPEIILLDEPTSFLDIGCAVEILDVLKKMAREEGVTVIMSLHELNYAKRVSDLVMCVREGGVMMVGKPEEVFTESVISKLYHLPEDVFAQLFGRL